MFNHHFFIIFFYLSPTRGSIFFCKIINQFKYPWWLAGNLHVPQLLFFHSSFNSCRISFAVNNAPPGFGHLTQWVRNDTLELIGEGLSFNGAIQCVTSEEGISLDGKVEKGQDSRTFKWSFFIQVLHVGRSLYPE